MYYLNVFSLQPDGPLDHLFSTYQVSIMQSCDLCGSYIWAMEKAYMCSGEFKKQQDNNKCNSFFFFLIHKNDIITLSFYFI